VGYGEFLSLDCPKSNCRTWGSIPDGRVLSRYFDLCHVILFGNLACSRSRVLHRTAKLLRNLPIRVRRVLQFRGGIVGETVRRKVRAVVGYGYRNAWVGFGSVNSSAQILNRDTPLSRTGARSECWGLSSDRSQTTDLNSIQRIRNFSANPAGFQKSRPAAVLLN
jgi:hypothetical protein